MKFIYKCIKKTTRQVAVQALSKEIWFIFLPLVLLLTSSFFFCFPISFLVLLYILECPYTLTPFQLVFPFFIFLSFFSSKAVHEGHFTFFSFLLFPQLFPHPWGTFWSQYSSIAPANGHHSKHVSCSLKVNREKKIFSPQALILLQKELQSERVHKNRRWQNTSGLMPACVWQCKVKCLAAPLQMHVAQLAGEDALSKHRGQCSCSCCYLWILDWSTNQWMCVLVHTHITPCHCS